MEVSDLEVLAWRLFEESNDAVFVVDSEAVTIQQANPASQRLTGLRWRQLRGRRLDRLVRSDRAAGMHKLLSAIRETAFFHSQEDYLLFRHQLDPLPINISVSRIHAPSGQLGLVVARDINEQRKAERALQKLSSKLEHQVRLRTQELRTANQQLTREVEERVKAEQALQDTNDRLREVIGQLEHAQEHALRRERLHALEQIAGGVAHDINNSLSAVTSFSELILQKDLDAETHEWATAVGTASQDIAEIVRRLRHFYGEPVDQGTTERINLVRLAKDAAHLTSPQRRKTSRCQRRDIKVTVSAEADPSIVGDASALRSVLTNLMLNAADAVADTGEITLRIAEEPATAVIEVIDDGIGMTEEQQRRCLEPFYTTKSDGTGLGLSVCLGIVKSHGGRLEMESNPGEGTTIRLLLPMQANLAELSSCSDSATVSSQDISRRLAGRRLLYIDDNELARRSTAALLGSLGLCVDLASDGRSGLSMFRDHRYDAVITDMSMPGMDGLQVTAEMKLLHPTIPVIVISGWSLVEPGDDGDRGRPDRVLRKPASSDQLTGTLAKLLGEPPSTP